MMMTLLRPSHHHRSVGVRRECTTTTTAAPLPLPLRRVAVRPQAAADPFKSASPAAPILPFATTTAAAASPAPAAAAAAAAAVQQPPWSAKSWVWRGHRINYLTAGCGEPVLLCHGFGASARTFRRTIPALAAAGHKVYAIDLLGFGASEKPVREYTIELWAELVADFVREFELGGGVGGSGVSVDGVSSGSGSSGGDGDGSGSDSSGGGVVLVGNSIGSLVCLTAAASLPPGAVAGLAFLNSAAAMNNKGVLTDWRAKLLYPVLKLIDLLLSVRPVAAYLFDRVRDRANLEAVLKAVYANDAAVDDELVDIIASPADDPAALDVFVSVITGPPGPKPWDLLPCVSAPLLVLWGDADTLTPLDSPVGQFFAALPAERRDTEFVLLEGAGHVPYDDRPDLVHAALLPWVRRVAGGSACSASASEC